MNESFSDVAAAALRSEYIAWRNWRRWVEGTS
ncbi:hypothetical protein OH492_18025 [Vibrio chagasii]|nr:hypothetical protein [Vibrio chagasii]